MSFKDYDLGLVKPTSTMSHILPLEELKLQYDELIELLIENVPQNILDEIKMKLNDRMIKFASDGPFSNVYKRRQRYFVTDKYDTEYELKKDGPIDVLLIGAVKEGSFTDNIRELTDEERKRFADFGYRTK